MKIFSIFIFLIYVSYVYSQNSHEITDEFYKRGELFKVIDNDSVQIVASLQDVDQYGHYYRINLSIVNKSNHRCEFIPANVTAEYVYHKKEDKFVKVPSFPYETYAQKVKGHISAAEVFSVIGASLQALSTTPTTSVSYRDNTGYRSDVDVYNQSAKDKETRENFDRIERYSRFKYEFAESEKDFYLLRETLFPQSAIWGYVMVKYKKCHDFNVKIVLEGDVYQFNWVLLDPKKEMADKMTDDMYK